MFDDDDCDDNDESAAALLNIKVAYVNNLQLDPRYRVKELSVLCKSFFVDYVLLYWNNHVQVV